MGVVLWAESSVEFRVFPPVAKLANVREKVIFQSNTRLRRPATIYYLTLLNATGELPSLALIIGLNFRGRWIRI